MKHGLLLRALMALMAMSWLLAFVSTPAQATSCPCSMFGNAVPTVDEYPDNDPVKLGMQFHTDVDGYATAIRFYKGAGNTGTHVGQLWAFDTNASAHTLMANVTFTGETASGWQEAALPVPIFLIAGHTYVVSYLSPAGHYAYDGGYFNTPRSNGPLHAEGPGSRYIYDSSNSATPFLASTANYWVDIQFETAARGRSLFNNTTNAPAVPQTGNDPSYELGTRFSSDVSTTVIGVRYWNTKDYAISGPANLWKNDGTLLATATYTDLFYYQGWYEVYFDNPVTIEAGTEYVASYWAQANSYGYTTGYFSVPYVNGSLHAPVNAGVFTQSATSVYPSTQSSINYWVEPIFEGMNVEASFTTRVEVEPMLSMTVAAHAGACNGVNQSAGVSSSSTTVNLGHLSSSNLAVAAQDLRVITNAAHGYTLYAQSAGPLNDGKGHSISDLAGGLSNSSPGSFASPGTAAFGYTTSDFALSVTGLGANRFTNPSAKWAPMSTSPAEVSHAAIGNVDKTVCIAYGARMAGDTPSGLYATSITYSAVPLF